MNEYKMALIDSVIEQIKLDIIEGNFEAMAGMLDFLPVDVMEAYLPESV